jgi:hypothetical protein
MHVKESYQKEQEELFAQNLSFEEWLVHYKNEPLSDKEIRRLRRFLKNPLNNSSYQPLQGA